MSKQQVFGTLSDGRSVTEYTLSNKHGVVATILNYGGIIRTLHTPNRHGKSDDIVLGFDRLADYENERKYFGAIVGRVAGRIAGGRLQVGDNRYKLTVNDPPNHLHGGERGFDSQVWDAEYCERSALLSLSYVSLDGEEGYPGELHAQVTYQLTDDNELVISYQASANAQTVVNLTQHSYFNLSGDSSRTVLDHDLVINAGMTLELDDNGIPTGHILDVSDTELDFRLPRKVCELDNFWVLADIEENNTPILAAELRNKDSGRVLQVRTTAPGIQVYSGGLLPRNLMGKSRVAHGPHRGICLETQIHPDSPNHKDFPLAWVGPGTEYESTTIFRFSTDKCGR